MALCLSECNLLAEFAQVDGCDVEERGDVLHLVALVFHAPGCLHQALVDGRLSFGLLVLLPFCPVGLAQIAFHLFKQRGKVVLDDIANLAILDFVVISVSNGLSHISVFCRG